ncbi:MAG TPA: hypothetical protein VN496_00450, partial [Burkholderiales bacterium]|nr:hypothetical protein [Burkholderiales bacterium]
GHVDRARAEVDAGGVGMEGGQLGIGFRGFWWAERIRWKKEERSGISMPYEAQGASGIDFQ